MHLSAHSVGARVHQAPTDILQADFVTPFLLSHGDCGHAEQATMFHKYESIHILTSMCIDYLTARSHGGERLPFSDRDRGRNDHGGKQ